MALLTKAQLNEKLRVLEPEDDEQRNEMVCVLIGHSNICTAFFGYRYCGRCKAELGDSLGSMDFGIKDAVIIGHNCPTCQENYKKCTWRDKLYVPDPFKDESE